MSTSEIAKLERLWRENRQGFTFAPLAEAYRKLKDTSRALEILAEGMAQRPDYIPASIVLGRCHLDLGDDGQAELAFRHVLELDNENVIALKALAEISERQGKLTDAASHLRDLLEVDRSNDDARFHLARLETRIAEGDEKPAEGPAEAADVAVEEPDSHQTVEGAPTDSAGVSELETAESSAAEDVNKAADDEPLQEAELSPIGGVEWMGAPAENVEEIEPDPSIVLQDHLDVPDDVEQVGGLEIEDVPEISDASADATAMSGLVGQDFDEHSQGVRPLSDLTSGTVRLDEEDVDDFEPVYTEGNEVGSDPRFEDGIESDADDAEGTGDEADLEVAGEAVESVGEADDLAEIVKSEDLELTPTEENEFQVPSDAESLMSSVSEEHDAWDSNPDVAAAESSTLGTVADTFGADALAPSDAARPDVPDPMDNADQIAGPDEPPVGDEFTEEEVDAPRPGFLAMPATAEQDALYSPPEPELVVTESMAELYRRQGHRAEALAVYRLLYQRHPEDLRLREKVDELETEAAEEDSPRPVEQLTATDPARSVGALLRTLLRARPAGAGGSWPAEAGPAEGLASPGSAGEGSPTRPADDHLSLSDVFGDDTSPIPPAVPSAEESAASGVSFDAFFGDTGTPAPASSRTPSRDDEDLDQFHSWLQNLKR